MSNNSQTKVRNGVKFFTGNLWGELYDFVKNVRAIDDKKKSVCSCFS